MGTQTIDGKCYARMLMGGLALLASHTEELNALNVFPVCDGDTGTNMRETMEGGIGTLPSDSIDSIGTLSKLFARGMLLSARGNSGVILSQIFAGINEKLESCDTVDVYGLAQAYRNGIVRSYAAVQNPTEGTILTVFRESTEYAASKISEKSTAEDFLRLHIDEARRSLQSTKEILPVLAEANVVDSGAAGYLYIAEGMYEALGGAELSYHSEIKEGKTNGVNADIDSFTRDSVLEYGYCTEFLLRLTSAKTDPDAFEVKTLVSALEDIGGESIVAYKEGDIVKVHVHTFFPGKAMNIAQAYGEFLTVKVENMSLGHSETVKNKEALQEKKKPFAIAAVASGDGMTELFKEMGADRIISGGQTSNPSAEEFIEAFRECHAENIIVLPNNKNIILAAKQASELYDGAKVHIIETKNLMQGYSALSVITPGITDIDSLIGSARRAAESVTDCEVTAAVRDAVIDGRIIKKGDYIAISGNKIVAVCDSAEEAVLEMLESTDADLCEIITLFTGKNVSDQARAELTEKLEELYCDCEITVYEGGQDIYDYFLAIE